MNIGITGASGMLGTALVYKLSKEFKIYATSRKEGVFKDQIEWSCFDLLDFDSLNNWLENNNLDIVVHCAAMVNIDQCEENQGIAEDLHYKTTKIISRYLNKTGGRLIYISTDHLFDGRKKGLYTEKDRVNPLNTYARTKLEGERVALSMENGLAIRTNIIGRSRSEKPSFAEWIIKDLADGKKLNLFDDVFFSPLHVSDLSDMVFQLIQKQKTGLYNASSLTSLSKYEFGLMAADVFNLESDNIVKSSIKYGDLNTDRPKNMGLSSAKLSAVLNKKMPSTERGIELLKYQYDNYRV